MCTYYYCVLIKYLNATTKKIFFVAVELLITITMSFGNFYFANYVSEKNILAHTNRF